MVSERDRGVRAAALNMLEKLYLLTGSAGTWALLGQLSPQQQSLIEERLRYKDKQDAPAADLSTSVSSWWGNILLEAHPRIMGAAAYFFQHHIWIAVDLMVGLKISMSGGKQAEIANRKWHPLGSLPLVADPCVMSLIGWAARMRQQQPHARRRTLRGPACLLLSPTPRPCPGLVRSRQPPWEWLRL